MKQVFTGLALLACLLPASITCAQDAPVAGASPAEPGAVYRIDYDYSRTPELKDWVDKQLRPALELWYPIIVADLPSEGFTAPRHFTVTIDPDYDGVAATSDTHVVVSPKWIKSQVARGPLNEAVGSVVHEAVHVAQQYGGAKGANPVPGWLTEGIADYIRWWKFEPAAARRPVRPTHRDGKPASYTDSYQTTAAFLEYVAKNHDHEIVVKLNAIGRAGTYTPDLWKQYTGKTADELWAEFVATLKR
jgi:hypothetical protein